jgi:hypothetical protein
VLDKYLKDSVNTLKMSKRVVNIGLVPNDGTGDSLRDGMDKINQNFSEIYDTFGNGSSLDITQIIDIGDATTLDGQDGLYYLNYNNFQNIPTDLSSFNNSVGFVTANIIDGYATENFVINSLVGFATETYVNSQLDLKANLTGANFSGIVTATQFFGDGSGLIGVVATGSGVEVLDDGSVIGTASTIDFGSNITIAISAGIATVNVQVPTVYFDSNVTGIHTLSNVGIGTTNAGSRLTVSGDVNITGVTTVTGNYFYVGNPNITSNFTSGVILDTSGKITHQSVGGETHIVGYAGSSLSYALSKDGNLYLGGGNPDEGGTGGNISLLGQSGKIGIGTTLPNSELDLYGSLYVDNNLNVSGSTIFSGNVGVGTTNATDKLTVSGGDISVGINTSEGLILTSENGTRYRLIVADDGTLSTVAV